MNSNDMFRVLNPEDVEKFRKWARANYVPGSNVNELWHPAVRAECEAMNLEAVQRRPPRNPGDSAW